MHFWPSPLQIEYFTILPRSHKVHKAKERALQKIHNTKQWSAFSEKVIRSNGKQPLSLKEEVDTRWRRPLQAPTPAPAPASCRRNPSSRWSFPFFSQSFPNFLCFLSSSELEETKLISWRVQVMSFMPFHPPHIKECSQSRVDTFCSIMLWFFHFMWFWFVLLLCG